MESFSIDLLQGINYWAVATAGLLSFFLGGLWYSPALFEEAWIRANGYEEEQVRRLQAALGPVTFGTAFASYLAMALVFAVLVAMLGIETLGAGLLLAALVWFGFAATTGLAVNLFSDRSLRAWLIDASFQLAFLLMTGAILSLWRS